MCLLFTRLSNIKIKVDIFVAPQINCYSVKAFKKMNETEKEAW